MRVIFWDKSVWTKEEWSIFLAKLDVLRFRDGIKKRQFSDKIGVKNIYRKDLQRPGAHTIATICKLYNVTEQWLCSDLQDDPGYKQAPVTSLFQRDPDKCSYGTPDLSGHSVIKVITPEGRISHKDLITQFQNKETAADVNMLLLEIERTDPAGLDTARTYLQGLLEGLRLKKKKANS